MKKPEPCAVPNWRPRGAPSGMPKRLKNFSIGEPFGNGTSSSDLDCADVRILTRTEITAGFTFSTMSAKPVGRATCCACCDRFCANAPVEFGRKLRATKNEAAVRLQMVVARSAMRRAERLRGLFGVAVIVLFVPDRCVGGEAP